MKKRLTHNLLLFLFSTIAILFAGDLATAQVLPFQFDGSGIVDFIPLVEGTSAAHVADGTATFLGNYQSEGIVRLDMFTSPTTGLFSSEIPVVFTGENGDELHMNYAGNVELTDAGNNAFTATFVAEFNPVIGSSTGQFANVIDGSIIVTAITDSFVPGEMDVPFSWGGPPGWLEFVPEPSSTVLLISACLGLLGFTRRRR